MPLQILLMVLLGMVAADSEYRYVLPFHTTHYQPTFHAVVPQVRTAAVHQATPAVIQYRAPAAVQYSAPAAVQYKYSWPAVPTVSAATYSVKQYDDDDDDDDVKYLVNPYSALHVRGRSFSFDDDDDHPRVATTYAKFDDDDDDDHYYKFDFDDLYDRK